MNGVREGIAPWARVALGEENLLRLQLHVAPNWRLQVIGATPAMFTVRVWGPGGVDYDWQRVPRDILWDAIVKALAFVGQPLEPDEEWAKTKEAIGAE
jgi:hypothetical protein